MNSTEVKNLKNLLGEARSLIENGDVAQALRILDKAVYSDEAFLLAFHELRQLYELIRSVAEIPSETVDGLIAQMHARRVRLTRERRATETKSARDEETRSRRQSRSPLPPVGVPSRDSQARTRQRRLTDDLPRTGRPRRRPMSDLSEPVTLFPHLDLRPDDGELVVSVYLDRNSFHKDEYGEPVVAQAGSVVQAQLVTSDHFEILGSSHRTCTISKESEKYSFRDFLIRPRENAAPITGDPVIGALFTVDGRPSGNVKKAVDASGAVRDIGTIPPQLPIEIIQEPGGKADLTITVMNNPINDGRQFVCVVSSPHLPDFIDGKSGAWNLSDRSEATVIEFMKGFTDANIKVTPFIAGLIGAGKMLFDASPQVFRDAYWQLLELGKLPTSIAVVSEEPFIPWELMIPNGGPYDLDQDIPLGVSATIGRWIYAAKSPRRSISISESRVFAPKYSGKLVLAKANAEALAVIKAFPGKIISPVSFDELASEMLSGPSLIHFVCHGKDANASGQYLLLDNEEKITDAELRGITGITAAFKKTAPIVFLNACEVGRGNPALVGPRGFAAQFIKLGAQAVIAPLWSVKDEIAHAIAVEFYDRVKDQPELPLAEIFKEIRNRAYKEGRDSYAAYCFFGDPLAVASKPN